MSLQSEIRSSLIRRGRTLAWLTIAWNAVEGLVGIASGIAASSIALVGFGVDSYVEVFAGSVILWRLSKQRMGQHIWEHAERRAVRLIAVTFFLLAIGVTIESIRKLITGERPEESAVGLVLAVVSLIAMPLLARSKRQVGRQLRSQALQADAAETALCMWLSVILLAGLGLNSLFGWWWADPLAGLAIAYVAAREGVENWRAEEVNSCCSRS
jgi:divalent metal cation (Fe/Co/Zn/Cd) transporter